MNPLVHGLDSLVFLYFLFHNCNYDRREFIFKNISYDVHVVLLAPLSTELCLIFMTI